MAPPSSESVDDPDSSASDRTSKLFTREPHNFMFYRAPTITVSSPNCGPSGQVGNLNVIAGENSPASLFPTLSWKHDKPEDVKEAKEYLVIIEDLDSRRWTWFADKPTPGLQGVFYGIKTGTTEIRAADLVPTKKPTLKWLKYPQRQLIGGFKFGDAEGKNGKIWVMPKSLHHIHFQVIALNKSIDRIVMSSYPTRESFNGAVEGNVMGWGEWVGIYQKS